MSTVVGPIAGTTYAAGEQLSRLAGVRLGRLAQAAAPGDTALVLERTLGMDPTGNVLVDGVAYAYGELTDGSLGDLVASTAQGTAPGVQANHARNAVVTDVGRNFSAVDFARGGLFVNTALGADLSSLGRILGVLRSPSLSDDAQYRAVIKAIAYNPRTTMYGLRTALDALVGAGNYTLYEDAAAAPATVFVSLAGNALLAQGAQGRTIVCGKAPAVLTNGSFFVSGPLRGVGAITLVPEAFWVNIGDVAPGSVNLPTQAGGQTPAFVFSGDPATVQPYTLGAGAQAQRLTAPGYFAHTAALPQATDLEAGLQALVPDATKLSGTDPRRFGLRVRLGTYVVGVGAVSLGNSVVGLGLADMRTAKSASDAGTFLAGTPAQVPQNTLFEAHISCSAQGRVRLLVNGHVVQRATLAQAGAAGDASGTATGFDIGCFAQTAGGGALRRAGLSAACATDFGAGGTATLTAAGASVVPASPPPFAAAAYEADAHTVLSAQVFAANAAPNIYVGQGPPPVYAVWPFYLTDPSYFITSYLSGMVAAGVSLRVSVATQGSP